MTSHCCPSPAEMHLNKKSCQETIESLELMLKALGKPVINVQNH